MRKLSNWTIVLVLLACLVVLSACGSKPIEAESPGNQTQEPTVSTNSSEVVNADYVLTFAHVDSTDIYTSTGHALGTIFKQFVEGKSGGRIRVDVYPSSQLGAQRELIEATMMGTVDMCSNGEGAMAGFYEPILCLSIPYLFRSEEVAWRVLDGPFGQELFEDMKNRIGIRTLAVADNGFRNFTTSDKLIKTPDDLKGLKIRVMENPAHMALIKALGAEPTPIAWPEVYTSLQQGVIDGQENPVRVSCDAKLYEQQKYFTLDGHLWGINNVLINEKKYQSLPDDLKAIVYEGAQIAATAQRGMSTISNQNSISTVLNAGCEVYTPTAEELELFRNATQEPVIKYIESVIDKEWIDKIMAAVETVEKDIAEESLKQ